MKNTNIFVLVLAVCITGTFLFAGCGKKTEEAAGDIKIDYGKSSIYSQEDMDDAIAVINKEFASWEGCEMHSLTYGTDDCMAQENLDWMNDLGEGETYTECIEFLSNFHSPKEAEGAWEPDKEYEDYQWWLARTDGGEWNLMTWGY